MTTLILADSRGSGLQNQLENANSANQTHTKVTVHSGAGYELVVLKSHTVINQLKPKLIVIFAGICDLTYRNKTTKITKLRYQTVNENVQHVIDAAKSAYDLIRGITVTKVTFATLTGIDLADYNHKPRKYMSSNEYKLYCNTNKTIHEQQTTLNMSVIEINRQLTKLNEGNSIPTVWTGGVVHLHSKRKQYHYYIRLYDGCHADDQTKGEWAKQINKAILRIKPN